MPPESITFKGTRRLTLSAEQLRPVENTPFPPTPNASEITMEDYVTGYDAQFRYIPVTSVKGLERLTILPETVAIGESSGFFYKPGTTPEALRWLVRAREAQIVRYASRHTIAEPNSLAQELSVMYRERSFIGRKLMVAMDDEDIYFIGRKRDERDAYGGVLEIPGGHRMQSEERFVQPVQSAVWREFGEEFLQIIPNPLLTRGVQLTHVQKVDTNKAYLETSELVVMPLELLNMMLDFRKLSREKLSLPTFGDWQRYRVQEVLHDHAPMLPSLYSSLNRLVGSYVTEYQVKNRRKDEKWLLYGEMLLFDKTFFQTRGQQLVELLQG